MKLGKRLIELCQMSGLRMAFKVQDKLNHLSDHCPISAVINIDVERKQSFKTNKKGIGAPKKMKWDIQTETMFKLRLSNQSVQEELSDLCKVQYDSGDQCEEGLSRINSILRKAADIKISKRYKFIKRKKVVRSKPWFSEDLNYLKNKLKSAGRDLLRNCGDPNLRNVFFKIKKKYKSTVKF